MTVYPDNTPLWPTIKCFFGLHPYKIIVKLKKVPTKNTIGGRKYDNVIEVPFEAIEVCKVCGKERNMIAGAIQDKERIPECLRKK